MQYYTERHRHTCGVDLHGRNLYLCVLDPDRKIVLHRRVDCDEEKVMRVLAPYREDLVIGVECMFKWYWLSDLCDEHGIPFVLGHALEMKAVHGRKSGNDRLIRQKTRPCGVPPIRARGDQVVLQRWYGTSSNPHSYLPQ